MQIWFFGLDTQCLFIVLWNKRTLMGAYITLLSLDRENRLRNAKERNRLTQKMLSEKKAGKKTQKIKKERSFIFHCDDESYSF